MSEVIPMPIRSFASPLRKLREKVFLFPLFCALVHANISSFLKEIFIRFDNFSISFRSHDTKDLEKGQRWR